MDNSDFLRTADRSSKDVAQGYVEDEFDGSLVPVPQEVNQFVELTFSFNQCS